MDKVVESRDWYSMPCQCFEKSMVVRRRDGVRLLTKMTERRDYVTIPSVVAATQTHPLNVYNVRRAHAFMPPKAA